MKKVINIFVVLIVASFSALSQSWPDGVTYVPSIANESVVSEGNLSSGKILSDLRWASSSSNACFTAVQFPKFQGNHVFYGTTIPPGCVMNISVTPSVKDEELSIYGYMVGNMEVPMVPNLQQCITCEADYQRPKPVRGKPLTSERSIEFRNPTTNTYNIVIGVSAPKGVTERKYRMIIRTVL